MLNGIHNQERLKEAANLILSVIPEKWCNDEIQQNTPERFERGWQELLQGYAKEEELEQMLTTFKPEGGSHLVAVTNISFFSVCEHHLLPFFGKAHVGYIPGVKILGASKLPRLVEIFARRLQIQERLTLQIAEALETYLLPRGVAVLLEGQHMCMSMRGVQKPGSILVTSEMRGKFGEDPAIRAEFLSRCKVSD